MFDSVNPRMMHNHIWLQLTMLYLRKLRDSAPCEGQSASKHISLDQIKACNISVSEFSRFFFPSMTLNLLDWMFLGAGFPLSYLFRCYNITLFAVVPSRYGDPSFLIITWRHK